MTTMKYTLLNALFGLSLAASSHAANITNNIKGVGPSAQAVNPYICIQNKAGEVTYKLKPGETVDGNKYSGNIYFVGATLRFGGCDSNNTYLGYLGLDVNDQHSNKIDSYNPPEGVHIAYANAAINSSGKITGNIVYTPIKPNFNLLDVEPSHNPTWAFVGANLSGLEFGKMPDPVVVPNLSEEDAAGTTSDLADTKAFLHAGMNAMRVPLHWGFLQPNGAGKGELNADYVNSYLKPLLETLTSAHVNAIVDLHAYMRYSEFGKQYAGCGMDGQCPDGTLVTDAKVYQDVWHKLYLLIKNDPKINMNYIILDLMNEPVSVPNDLVFSIQAEVIKTLRADGYQGYILVEGNGWSGLHSWSTLQWTSQDGKTTYTNASLFTRDNFIKAGITDLSKIVINAHQYLDSDFSGTHDQCMTDLTTTGPSGFNLTAFTDYLQQNRLKAIVTEFGSGRESASCSTAMTQFMDYLKNNSLQNKEYGFIGWTIWSTGHGWGDYNLRIKPTSYQMDILNKYLLAV
jgi:endoglucanase